MTGAVAAGLMLGIFVELGFSFRLDDGEPRDKSFKNMIAFWRSQNDHDYSGILGFTPNEELVFAVMPRTSEAEAVLASLGEPLRYHSGYSRGISVVVQGPLPELIESAVHKFAELPMLEPYDYKSVRTR